MEKHGGARIIRCQLILSHCMSNIWHPLAPLSFAVTFALIALWQLLRHRPDVELCVEPALMGAAIAVGASRLVGARFARHVFHAMLNYSESSSS